MSRNLHYVKFTFDSCEIYPIKFGMYVIFVFLNWPIFPDKVAFFVLESGSQCREELFQSDLESVDSFDYCVGGSFCVLFVVFLNPPYSVVEHFEGVYRGRLPLD